MIEVGKAADRWSHLESYRNAVLRRAEAGAALTIPTLLPPTGHSEGNELPQPYQSLGAKAVNNLAAKINLALFPPNTPFFRLRFDEITQAQLSGEVDLDEINKDLSLIEKTVVAELEQTKLRPVMATCAKHLITTGNYCVDVMPEMNFRGFGLQQFVVTRDPEGAIVELIIREKVSPPTLEKELLDAVFSAEELREYSTDPNKTLDLFTVMYREDGKYKVHQELNSKLVPESKGTYPLEAPRFVVLRWTSITNEDYGRGLVDEYFGDIQALDYLSRDLLKASALAAKVIYTTDPNSYITPKKLQDAHSGDVLKGKADDIGTIGIDKLHDFQVVLERLHDIERGLSEAFLMNSSVQRDAERVTAEEIRFMAQDLEDSLGGVYSSLAQDMQVPLLRRVLDLLSKSKLIPKLPNAGLKLSITTGIEALGRGHEVTKLIQFVQAAREAVGEQELTMRLDAQGILNTLAAGFGLTTDGIVRTEDQVQELQQMAQAQALMQSAGPGVMQEAIKSQGGNQ